MAYLQYIVASCASMFSLHQDIGCLRSFSRLRKRSLAKYACVSAGLTFNDSFHISSAMIFYHLQWRAWCVSGKGKPSLFCDFRGQPPLCLPRIYYPACARPLIVDNFCQEITIAVGVDRFRPLRLVILNIHRQFGPSNNQPFWALTCQRLQTRLPVQLRVNSKP